MCTHKWSNYNFYAVKRWITTVSLLHCNKWKEKRGKFFHTKKEEKEEETIEIKTEKQGLKIQFSVCKIELKR